MQPGMQIQAVQYVFDTKKDKKELLQTQKDINQSVANGFVILATPTVDGVIYYQMARQIPMEAQKPRTVLDRLKKK